MVNEWIGPQGRGAEAQAVGPNSNDAEGILADGEANMDTTQTDANKRLRPPNAHTQVQLARPQKNTRANIKIASLNIQGKGANSIYDPKNKWNKINQLMRENDIAILAVQEAHLDHESCEKLNDLFYNITIFTSPDPSNPNSKGVAFALNNRLAAIGKNLRVTEIIPGRAILIETRWHSDEVITILNIYAPNNRTENKNFWKELDKKWTNIQSDLTYPDIVLGDFNLTEERIDRCNGNLDNSPAINSLQEFINDLELTDGWRSLNPNLKAYTLLHNGNKHQSRLDRIYLTQEKLKTSQDWTIQNTAIPSDHKMVSCRIAKPNIPFIGKGRWTIPLFVLGNRKFIQEVENLGKELLQKMKNSSPVTNTLAEWESFKESIIGIAKNFAKKPLTSHEKKKSELEARIKLINHDHSISDEERKISIALLEKERSEIEQITAQLKRHVSEARHHLEGETVCKYWTNLYKNKKPRDLITKLKKPNANELDGEDRFEKRSDGMAEIARLHHEELQTNDISTDPGNISQREHMIIEVLGALNEGLKEDEKARLEEKLTDIEIQIALAASANGKAPGLDGIPYELWKLLLTRFTNLKKENKEGFDVIETMKIAFNHIENKGLNETSNFHEGWMCPIFKKGEVTEIANYRPITVLNTDYKIFTKAIQAKLALAAPNIIHKNQAGFMKGRSIIDHIHTIKLMTDYAEISPENEGAIIALDQEKAYDKIAHDYLWHTLSKLNFPEKFISTVRSLYTGAQTRVMVNGVLSNPFLVSRGVRQGDPLSCLLFNMAIEPLACMIRDSSIQGAKIPNLRQSLKVLLFADDTTVFLSKNDEYETLSEILTNWCKASRAKFNISKTEIIPIGSREYRQLFYETRQLNPNQATPIDQNIHISGEGELVRILGAWIGNGGREENPWNKVLLKVENHLKDWNKGKLGLEGKRHAIQMSAGGCTQYLTKAQGMPEETENKLDKMVKNFIWNEKKQK